MHRREGEQGGHGRAVSSGIAIREAHELGTGGDGGLGERNESVERVREPFLRRERRVEAQRLERLDPRRVEEEAGQHGHARAAAPSSASVAERGPMSVDTDMTRRSRRWSIAGFVTCAKRWRR